MYWFWYFMFAVNPSFLLLGMSGILGKEAEKAANDLAAVFGVLILILVALAAIFYLLRFMGLV